MANLLRKGFWVCLIVSLFILVTFGTGSSSGKIKLEKEFGIVVPVAGVTDLPNEVTLRMYESSTAAIPLTSQTFPRGEYSAYYNMTKSDGLTEMNVVKFEIKFNNFDKFLDYLDTIKRTEDFWIEVDFDGKLIGQREQLDRQITKQILATVTAQSGDTSDPSSAQSAGQSGGSSTSGTKYQLGSSLVKDAGLSFVQGNVAGSDGQVQYNNGGVQAGASQFYYDDVNHRVGIGTTSPVNKFDVRGDINLGATAQNSAGGNWIELKSASDPLDTRKAGILLGQAVGASSASGYIDFYTANYGVNYDTRMRISKEGNVGIGTASPVTKLDVRGNINLGATAQNAAGGNLIELRSASDPADTRKAAIFLGQSAGTSSASGYIDFYTANYGVGYDTRMRISKDGNVGIGTTSPCSDCKLAVNGKIRAKEIVVDTGWSDFVFYDNYTLMPLQEVEKFIKENQHLPGIPTAADVEKDGISLGNISAKLLQKIEELTLYMIDLKKENHVLKGDLAALRNQMNKK